MACRCSRLGPVRPFPWPGPAGIRKFWFSDSGFGFEAWTQAATHAPLICCEPASLPLGIPCLGMERMATGCNDTLAPPPPQPRLSAIFPTPLVLVSILHLIFISHPPHSRRTSSSGEPSMPCIPRTWTTGTPSWAAPPDRPSPPPTAAGTRPIGSRSRCATSTGPRWPA